MNWSSSLTNNCSSNSDVQISFDPRDNVTSMHLPHNELLSNNNNQNPRLPEILDLQYTCDLTS